MGNGLLTFVDKKVQLNDFFKSNEIIFYSDTHELSDKLPFSKNDKIRKNCNEWEKVFQTFNEKRIADYFIKISTGQSYSLF